MVVRCFRTAALTTIIYEEHKLDSIVYTTIHVSANMLFYINVKVKVKIIHSNFIFSDIKQPAAACKHITIHNYTHDPVS